jgi:hypothetical protein
MEPEVSLSFSRCPPLVPILKHMNSVHTLQTYSGNIILTPSSHLHLGFPSGHIPSCFQTKILYVFFMSTIISSSENPWYFSSNL